ncbi:MAG: enoyl-CoA hydratase/isomerase family protein [Gemmatimonadota bacterium]|nr:enoyl-CoA hydratase/isomerase family protein [Gemmatimonadota bacterium]MDE2983645.1 enoyl-CoA hydratase/isomerase family protein [Gemmatimonadota bacterium]
MSAPGRDSLVLLETRAGVATLTLNRPRKRNALSPGLVAELSARLARAASDPEVRVVALSGAGPDFCAGADLSAIAASQREGPEAGLADARRLGEVFVTVRRVDRPVVALVRGRALGGGCGLASACDIVLAHPDAIFGYPEVHLGFVPALVMAPLRRKVGEAAAFELVARGRRIGAAEAVSLGLATRVLPGDDFGAAADEYLRELAGLPATAVALTKRLFHGLDGVSYEAAIARGAEVNAMARQTGECRDGVKRFLDRKGD